MKTRLRTSRRVEVLGHLDRVLLRHADALRVGAPLRQRADAVSHTQPRAARAELIDDADELVAGRERRLRAAEIRAGAHLGIAERHARGQNPDADLARTRSGIVLLHHAHNFGAAEVVDDDTLHDPTSSLVGCRYARKLLRVAEIEQRVGVDENPFIGICCLLPHSRKLQASTPTVCPGALYAPESEVLAANAIRHLWMLPPHRRPDSASA